MGYNNIDRYAKEPMAALFSDKNRVTTFRKLWAALAEFESNAGLPITKEQVKALKEHITDINMESIYRREKETHHDVMANIQEYASKAPIAGPIIHLGATSCYVSDNTDLIVYRDALKMIDTSVCKLVCALGLLAESTKNVEIVGYTHYQPAQPVTLGKRIAIWIDAFEVLSVRIEDFVNDMQFLGCRGATGTEASLLTLFNGNTEQIDWLNKRLAITFGFKSCFPVVGQTYPRSVDFDIMCLLTAVSNAASKMCNDIRLMEHDEEVFEPFGKKQVGSSAMPYKHNPITCERIVSLARCVRSNLGYSAETAATQWLERTLDDSAGRRLKMTESFILVDHMLRTLIDMVGNLTIDENAIKSHMEKYADRMVAESIMMEIVKRGGDRQKIHEILRKKYADKLGTDVAEYLSQQPDALLTITELKDIISKAKVNISGRSAEQTEKYLESKWLGGDDEIDT